MNRVIFCMILVFGIVFTGCFGAPHKGHAQIGETKANLHTIQIALERYGVDNSGLYPDDLDLLFSGDYVIEFPQNAYTSETMQNVSFSDDAPFGDFTYIPVDIDGEIKGYFLICYGELLEPTSDLNEDGVNDTVILVLEGYSGGITLPDIKDLL